MLTWLGCSVDGDTFVKKREFSIMSPLLARMTFLPPEIMNPTPMPTSGSRIPDTEPSAFLSVNTTRQEGKTIAIMPAYNAAATLKKTLDDFPPGVVDQTIVVDDCSHDNTAEVARQLGLTVIVHDQNTGYGGNQKTCYRRALELEADYIVMVHPDYQYDPRVIGLAVETMKLGILDVVIGSRIRTRRETLAGGMPLYKYLANRFLTSVENSLLGQNLGDFHSGFRAYRREVLETIPFENNSDDFVFDSQFLAQVVHFGFRMGDIPVPVRYFAEASSINFRRSLKYGLSTLGVLCSYHLNRWGLRKSNLYEVKQKELQQH